MKFIDLQILVKDMWHKINCLCNNHKWIIEHNSPNNIYIYHRHYRFCKHCCRYQYREVSPYKDLSQIYEKKWEDFGFPHETDTQKVYKHAKKLTEKAVSVDNELAKFDSCVKQKTKVFMNLIKDARELSEGFMKLKTEIRELHIQKQKDDISKTKSNT